MKGGKNHKGHDHGPGCSCGHHHSGTCGENQGGRAVPDFPTEVVFKAVFRNSPYTLETLKSLCGEAGIDAVVTERESGKGNFISYTITAVFPDESTLKNLCNNIGGLEGFYTMF